MQKVKKAAVSQTLPLLVASLLLPSLVPPLVPLALLLLQQLLLLPLPATAAAMQYI
jgi:hypothetical protein